MMNPLSKNNKVIFEEGKLPYEVIATKSNFAIVIRPLDFEEDYEILENRVEMRAYFSIEEAYEHLKNDPVYSIIDFENGIRGADNYYGKFDYSNESEAESAIDELITGTLEISRRNFCELNIKEILKDN